MSARFDYKSQSFTISYSSEKDIQDSLIALSHAHGWLVESEVNVPGWGRIDLILHESETERFTNVIELKTSLTKLSTIRKAFQQADGYGKWLQSQGVYKSVLLSAPEIDFELANDIAFAYLPTVELVDVGVLMGHIAKRGYTGERKVRARARRDAALRACRLHNAAYNFAGSDPVIDPILDSLARGMVRKA